MLRSDKELVSTDKKLLRNDKKLLRPRPWEIPKLGKLLKIQMQSLRRKQSEGRKVLEGLVEW